MKTRIKRVRIVSALIVCITFYSCEFQNPKKTNTKETSERIGNRISELLKAYHKENSFQGSAFVSVKGKEVFSGGLGYSDIDKQTPNTAASQYLIASVTKQFTALLTMQMVGNHALELDAPITEYLTNEDMPDGSKFLDSTAKSITLHHLLTHTSGIPNYTDFPSYRSIMNQAIEPIDLIHLFVDSTLHFEPGAQFQYSNSGYALIGYILESVSGMRYEDLLQQHIFSPLKMNNSGYIRHAKDFTSFSKGYYKVLDSSQNAHPIHFSRAFSAGGIYSTVKDLTIYLEALHSVHLLSKEFKDILFHKHTRAWGEDYYGYGWISSLQPIGESSKRVEVWQHDGVINGYRSLVMTFPDQSTIVLLCNSSGIPIRHITKGIAGIIYDKPIQQPLKSLSNGLLKTIDSLGIAAGWEYFYAHRSDSTFYQSAGDMNSLGYHYFLTANNPEIAENILQMAIALYPADYNLYDSYGEILWALNKPKKAIDAYERSLHFEWKNRNATEKIKAIRSGRIYQP